MDAVRRLASLAIVLFGVMSIAAWASWFNSALDLMWLPLRAEDYPLGPDRGPLVFGFSSFLVAYIVYPPPPERD